MATEKQPSISGDDAKILVEALLNRIQTTKPLSAEAKADLDKGFQSQIEKYHAENHFWTTFHRNGEEDNVEVEYIGAAGVPYYIRKEHRVLLPQSALSALSLAEIVGLDHGHPVMVNGKKYLRKIRTKRFNVTIEPTPVSPEEAAQWRLKQERLQMEASQLVPMDGGDPLNDLVEVGE
jgi:hypothetical protein